MIVQAQSHRSSPGLVIGGGLPSCDAVTLEPDKTVYWQTRYSAVDCVVSVFWRLVF